jgi:hypothetical protein
MAYRESLREFTGPYTATSFLGKEVLFDLGQSTGPRSFNIAQIKPWPLRDKLSPLERPQLPLLQDKSPHAEVSEISWTEVIYADDPRAQLFDAAKKKGSFGLIEIGTFRLVLSEEAGRIRHY